MKNWRFSNNISLYFENGTICGHRRRMWSVEWCHFQWPCRKDAYYNY